MITRSRFNDNTVASWSYAYAFIVRCRERSHTKASEMRLPSTFALLPYEEGQHVHGNHCFGTWITAVPKQVAPRFLAREGKCAAPPQELRMASGHFLDLPARPGFGAARRVAAVAG